MISLLKGLLILFIIMVDNLSDDNMLQTQVDEETNVNDSDDNEVYNDVSDGGWIQWFCQLEGNEFFVEIDEDYLRNQTNLYGISKHIKNYK
jgi:hypothetical protein